MLITVMAAVPADAVSRQIVWRQLVDILAQERPSGDAELQAEAYAWLESLRAEVSPVVRASVARSVAQRTTDANIVRYFALDDPSIAAEMLRHANLSTDAWHKLINEIPPASRSLLRTRRDLAPEVVAALAAYRSADFILAGPSAPVDSAAPAGATAIADVVARIEAFRARKAEAAQVPTEIAISSTFELETDADGIVNFTSAQPRAAIIGLNLSVAGEQWLSGVDGYAAGAFRGRSGFRAAHLQVGGQSNIAGDWRLDGDPIFEPASGRFLGYRCVARRPLAHERAASPEADTSAESLRQLVHELRTPLNAILGFAEMIERELLGPIDASYRARATRIRADGARLLTAIEDVDLAARLEGAPPEMASSSAVDLAALLTLVGRDLSSLTDLRQLHLRVVRPAEILTVDGDPSALHRLLSRLLSLLLGLAEKNETLTAHAYREHATIVVTVTRPRRLEGYTEQALLSEGHLGNEDSDDAPLLGLGFGLRLINSLATALNVKFRIMDGAFALILAAVQDSPAVRQRISISHDDERLPS